MCPSEDRIHTSAFAIDPSRHIMPHLLAAFGDWTGIHEQAFV